MSNTDEKEVTVDDCPDDFDIQRTIEHFGCQPITEELINKLETITKKPVHPLIRRGLFVSHRDLDKILNDYEQGKKFYLYTGRGPSAETLHLGHLVPLIICKYLQDAFDCYLVIQITDDEKLLKKDLSMETINQYAIDNIAAIKRMKFNPEKTFIFRNLEYMNPAFYTNVVKIQSHITNSQAFAAFGITPKDNIGKTMFPAVQIAPCMPSTFVHLPILNMNCLIPCGIDQDPYFRLARDLLPTLGESKPALLHSTFLPSLRGVKTKMSSSHPESAIFITDTPAQIKKKVMKAFSGGHIDKNDQIMIGADLSVDVAYHYLKYFLNDDTEFTRITKDYGNSESTGHSHQAHILSGVVKTRCAEVIGSLIASYL